MITESKIYNISSSSATLLNNGSLKSDITFNIPNFIKRDSNIQNIYFSILSAEIPNSFYLINQYNNILSIQQNSITTNYSITYGNYNISTFLSTLQSLLTNFTITYNSITLKLTLTSSTAFIITTSSTIQRIMGLDTSTNLSSSLVNGLYSVTCPYVVNFLPYQKIHFRSPSLQLDNFNTYDNSTDIFFSIQNNTNLGNYFYYLNNNPTNKFLIEIDTLQSFQIRITDDKNRNIDFNNVDWYLSIKIDYELIEKIPKLNIPYCLETRMLKDEYINNLLKSTFL